VVIPSSPSIAALGADLDVPEGTLVGCHSRLIDELKRVHPHTVRLVSQPRDCTCVAYAFELNDDAVYRAIATDFDREIFAGKRFVDWMIRERLEEISQSSVGLFALYFSGPDWKHIGTAHVLNRITSQWGTYPVYEHDVCEV
jgi:hypothetical protein